MNVELIKELEERQSILSQLDKQYIAPTNEVPSGYFEGMEDAFFARLREDNAPQASKSINIWEKSKLSYSIAAVSIFAIVGLSIFSLLRNDNMNTLSQNEVESYLVEEDEMIIDSTVKISSPDMKLNDLTNEEITKYLIENEDIDLTQIN